MWEESLIFMLIYLGLFFMLPDKFRSQRNLPVTATVGILGACLGLYGIWRTKHVTEKFGAGLAEACGPDGKYCGAGDNMNLEYCLVNRKDLPYGEPDQSVLFNIYGRYIRIMPAETNGDGTINLAQIMAYGVGTANIAQGKTITSTNTLSGSPAPTILVNGTISAPQKLASGKIWSSDGTRSMRLEIDLGSIQMITKVRIIGRSDCCTSDTSPDRIKGIRVVVLKDLTTDVPTTGTCVKKPVPIFPTGTTVDEQAKIGDIILAGMNGQTALNILRGIKASTATSLTNYGLTDSQAAAAYNKLYTENLHARRAGWQFSGSWTTGTRTVTVTGGTPPIVNMKVKDADGIPVGTSVTAVVDNTVTLSANTTSTQKDSAISMNGDLNDSAYFAALDSVRNMKTVASITYDKSATVATYMAQHKGNIVSIKTDSSGNQIMTPTLDSTGNPVTISTLDSSGNVVNTPVMSPTFTTIVDAGETDTTALIMGVTVEKTTDPLTWMSSSTKSVAPTQKVGGSTGYNIAAPPDTVNWSSSAANAIPQQPIAINLPSVTIAPDTPDDVIVQNQLASTRTASQTIGPAAADAAATSAMNSAGYTAPRQNENSVGSVNMPTQKEVFWIGENQTYSYSTKADARKACLEAGADDLATDAQLTAAQKAGAQWCKCGWLKDTEDKKYPMQESGIAGCGSSGINNCGNAATSGATCYGNKPSITIAARLSYPSASQEANIYNKSARYIRIRPNLESGNNGTSGDGGGLNIANIVVKDDTGAIISTGKPVFATSTLPNSAPLAKIVDGTAAPRGWTGDAKTNGVWHTLLSSTRYTDTQYFEIDLGVKPDGSFHKIGSVAYYGRSDCCDAPPYDRNRGVRIEISKIPSPAPFSATAASYSWYQSTFIDTNTCPNPSSGSNNLKKVCNGKTVCVQSKFPTCDRSCPKGYSLDTTQNKCVDKSNIPSQYGNGATGSSGTNIISFMLTSAFQSFINPLNSMAETLADAFVPLAETLSELKATLVTTALSGSGGQPAAAAAAAVDPAEANAAAAAAAAVAADAAATRAALMQFSKAKLPAGSRWVESNILLNSKAYTELINSRKNVNPIGVKKEVFFLPEPVFTKAYAERACIIAGADGLATLQQLTDAQKAGAQWSCDYGWLKDSDSHAAVRSEANMPLSADITCSMDVGVKLLDMINTGSTLPGATCYGYKPLIIPDATLSNGSKEQMASINKPGRYVRIRPNISSGSDGHLNFSNIVVKDDTGAIISTGKPVFATSTLPNSAPLEKMVDGTAIPRPWTGNSSTNGSWHTGRASTTTNDTEYFEIDLGLKPDGSFHIVSSVLYYGRSDCCESAPTDRNRGVRIEVLAIRSPIPFFRNTTRITLNAP
jgi:hypothetical protein